MAVTLRSIRLRGLQVLAVRPPGDGDDDDDARATIDYVFAYKRRVDARGAKIKSEQPEVRSVQRATFVRNNGRRWLLLDSVDIPPPAQQQQQQQAPAEP